MSGEALSLTADDGHVIRGTFWPSAGERGLVQIAHGMAEHHARYRTLAEELAAAGWAVVAHDHRGHGESVGPGEELGHFADHDGWRRVLDDLRQVRAEGRRRARAGVFALLGHSMGSFIALSDVIDAPRSVDLLVLSGSNVGGGPLVEAGKTAAKVERLRQGARGKSALLSFLSFGSFNKGFAPTRTEFDWLSRDPDQVDAYVADPRCGFRCTNQLWIDLLGALGDLGKDARLARLRPELPVLLIAGARDPVSDGGKGVRALATKLRNVGLADVTTRIYEDARHEVFNETNRAEVVEDVLRFLETRAARVTRSHTAARS
ncbi:MAG: alpha/beta fold hydrolase [Sandaracinaceae bacterium]